MAVNASVVTTTWNFKMISDFHFQYYSPVHLKPRIYEATVVLLSLKWSHVCMFVYLEFINPPKNFSLIWRRHRCRWRAANYDLCSALMAIEQWGFFNVPHPLRHRPTVYNGHLWEPVPLTPNAERLAMELSLPVFTT